MSKRKKPGDNVRSDEESGDAVGGTPDVMDLFKLQYFRTMTRGVGEMKPLETNSVDSTSKRERTNGDVRRQLERRSSKSLSLP